MQVHRFTASTQRGGLDERVLHALYGAPDTEVSITLRRTLTIASPRAGDIDNAHLHHLWSRGRRPTTRACAGPQAAKTFEELRDQLLQLSPASHRLGRWCLPLGGRLHVKIAFMPPKKCEIASKFLPHARCARRLQDFWIFGSNLYNWDIRCFNEE